MEISRLLGIPQASVSRLLQRAADEGIVRHIVSPPAFLRLQTEALAKLRTKGIRDVRVATEGMGKHGDKNVPNLASAGAEYLLELLPSYEGHINIGMACGDTLLGLVGELTARLQHDPRALNDLMQKEITLYPLNLFWSHTLEFHIDTDPSTNIYPAALVVYFAMQLNDLGCKVRAHTAQPLLESSADEGTEGEEVVGEARRYFLEEAERADIFLLGIGTCLTDRKYMRVLEKLNTRCRLRDDLIVGEINYQPFDVNGQFVDLPKLAAVSGETLGRLAKTDAQVIGVAGGSGKIPAITALLNSDAPPFNVLITDEGVAHTI